MLEGVRMILLYVIVIVVAFLSTSLTATKIERGSEYDSRGHEEKKPDETEKEKPGEQEEAAPQKSGEESLGSSQTSQGGGSPVGESGETKQGEIFNVPGSGTGADTQVTTLHLVKDGAVSGTVQDIETYKNAISTAIKNSDVHSLTKTFEELRQFYPTGNYSGIAIDLEQLRIQVGKALSNVSAPKDDKSYSLKQALVQAQWVLVLQEQVVGKLRFDSLVKSIPSQGYVQDVLPDDSRLTVVSASLQQIEKPLKELQNSISSYVALHRVGKGESVYDSLQSGWNGSLSATKSGYQARDAYRALRVEDFSAKDTIQDANEACTLAWNYAVSGEVLPEDSVSKQKVESAFKKWPEMEKLWQARVRKDKSQDPDLYEKAAQAKSGAREAFSIVGTPFEKALYDLFLSASTAGERKSLDTLVVSDAEWQSMLDLSEQINEGLVSIEDRRRLLEKTHLFEGSEKTIEELQKESPSQEGLFVRVKRRIRDFLDLVVSRLKKSSSSQNSSKLLESVITQGEQSLALAYKELTTAFETTKDIRKGSENIVENLQEVIDEITSKPAQGSRFDTREILKQDLSAKLESNKGSLEQLRIIEKTINDTMQNQNVVQVQSIITDAMKRYPNGKDSLYDQWLKMYQGMFAHFGFLDLSEVPKILNYQTWSDFSKASKEEIYERFNKLKDDGSERYHAAQKLVSVADAAMKNQIAQENLKAFAEGPAAVKALEITAALNDQLSGLLKKLQQLKLENAAPFLSELNKTIETASRLEKTGKEHLQKLMSQG
jgi:hypothetical protein